METSSNDKTPEMIMIESQAALDMSAVISDLLDFQTWLASRGDVEQVEKLAPITNRLTDLLLVEGTYRAMGGRVFESFQKFYDQVDQLVDAADSVEEKASLPERLYGCSASDLKKKIQ